MSDQLTITISCQGATTINLEELHNLQGNLKTLSETDYVKLRNSIVEYGFAFPVFMWLDGEGKAWIVDAHSRIATLKKMQEEGYTIPPLPADYIHAANKTDAKKKLLLLNSRYGKITEEGMTEFVTEADSQINIEEMVDFLTYPEISLEFNDPANNNESDGGSKKEKLVKCPNCSHEFTA